jgi:hypothetical protein
MKMKCDTVRCRSQMSDLLHNPESWRKRATEARAIASGMTDPDAKRTMLGVAQLYERLAERAELRAMSRGKGLGPDNIERFWRSGH